MSTDSASYSFKIEFVTGSYTDLTVDFLRGNVIRSAATLTQQLAKGRLTAIMDNGQGYYTPTNTLSPYYGYLSPGKRVKLTCTRSGTEHNIFQGDLRTVSINPTFQSQQATLQFGDQVDKIARTQLTKSIIINTNPASLFTDIMSASNVRSFSVDDAFFETIPYASYDSVNADTALQELIKSGHYWIHNGPDEVLHFKNRYFNINGSVVNSYTEFYDLQFNQTFTFFNDIRVQANPYILDDNEYTVGWLYPDTVIVPASGAIGFFVNYLDPITQSQIPCNSMETPVSSQDYRLFTAVSSGGTEVTNSVSLSTTFFAMSAVCTAQNFTATDAYFNKFNLRGTPVRQSHPVSGLHQVSSSINTLGTLSFLLQNNLMNGIDYVQNYADFIGTQYGSPETDMDFSLKNIYPDILTNDLGDLNNIQHSRSGILGKYTTISIEHDIILQRGIEHTVKYGTLKWKDLNYLILDDPVNGLLDSNRVWGF